MQQQMQARCGTSSTQRHRQLGRRPAASTHDKLDRATQEQCSECACVCAPLLWGVCTRANGTSWHTRYPCPHTAQAPTGHAPVSMYVQQNPQAAANSPCALAAQAGGNCQTQSAVVDVVDVHPAYSTDKQVKEGAGAKPHMCVLRGHPLTHAHTHAQHDKADATTCSAACCAMPCRAKTACMRHTRRHKATQNSQAHSHHLPTHVHADRVLTHLWLSLPPPPPASHTPPPAWEHKHTKGGPRKDTGDSVPAWRPLTVDHQRVPGC